MESFPGGNFPDAVGASQFKKMESFSSGYFPIQIDGFFLRWEVPGGLGSLRSVPRILEVSHPYIGEGWWRPRPLAGEGGERVLLLGPADLAAESDSLLS
jgi:hypothetical protein